MIILFQGDSITDGNRYKDEASRWDLNHQIGHAYPYVIAATLGAKYPEKGYRFVNRGVSGDRIARMYGRWREDAVLLNPDVASVLIGVNDQSEGGSDPERFYRIYTMLIQELPRARFVLMEPFLLPVGSVAEGWTEKSAKMKLYREATAQVAAESGAVFVPLQDKFTEAARLTGPEYWIWDGVHPTEAGHGLIAFEWMRAARGLLG